MFQENLKKIIDQITHECSDRHEHGKMYTFEENELPRVAAAFALLNHSRYDPVNAGFENNETPDWYPGGVMPLDPTPNDPVLEMIRAASLIVCEALRLQSSMDSDKTPYNEGELALKHLLLHDVISDQVGKGKIKDLVKYLANGRVDIGSRLASDMLKSQGMMLTGDRFVISDTHFIMKTIFRGTRWLDNYPIHLRRMQCAVPSEVRFYNNSDGFQFKSRGVSFDYKVILSFIQKIEDEESK